MKNSAREENYVRQTEANLAAVTKMEKITSWMNKS